MKSDIEIARSIKLERIENIAEHYGIPTDELENYGKYIAKVPVKLIDEKKVNKSNLILVTAITPTLAGKCWCNGSNEYEIAFVYFLLVDEFHRNLCDVFPVVFKFICGDAVMFGYVLNPLQFDTACYLNI